MNQSKKIRIGTRDSNLAMWQAKKVENLLNSNNIRTEIVKIKSYGDIDLETPLSELGGKGVFTKALDVALLENKIDIAVHSLKDLPTESELPIEIIAVLEREDPRDAFVGSEKLESHNLPKIATIATGSNRRKAQWLSRYNKHTVIDLRGNVNTRLKKVEMNNWLGAIFASAGLKRLGLESHISFFLDWMLPAPGQGAMAVVKKSENNIESDIRYLLNHETSEICTGIERQLLNTLEAGCSAPVGAYARIEGDEIIFEATTLMPDGSIEFRIKENCKLNDYSDFGKKMAEKLLSQGANEIIEYIRR